MSHLYKAQTRFLFHAHIKIKIPAFNGDSVFDELFSTLEHVDKHLNSYQEGSQIDVINKNAGSFVDVDDETVLLLRRTIYWSEFFNGAFDITIMPLIRLWGFYKNQGLKVPSVGQITHTQTYVDYRNVDIEGNRVRIGKGQEIITGSFIKAYAVDKLANKMLSMGIDDAVINAGGSTIRAINNNLHSSWQVNVREPEHNNLLFTLNVGNCCYTTSSQQETFVTINNRRYGHILNPLTGFPSSNRQVGIITTDCMDGDIISTGLFLQPSSDAFLHAINKLQRLMPIEGYIIDSSLALQETNGFKSFKIN